MILSVTNFSLLPAKRSCEIRCLKQRSSPRCSTKFGVNKMNENIKHQHCDHRYSQPQRSLLKAAKVGALHSGIFFAALYCELRGSDLRIRCLQQRRLQLITTKFPSLLFTSNFEVYNSEVSYLKAAKSFSVYFAWSKCLRFRSLRFRGLHPHILHTIPFFWLS